MKKNSIKNKVVSSKNNSTDSNKNFEEEVIIALDVLHFFGNKKKLESTLVKRKKEIDQIDKEINFEKVLKERKTT